MHSSFGPLKRNTVCFIKLCLAVLYFHPLHSQVLIEFKGKTTTVYSLSGGDEFNGAQLDQNKWMTAYPWARHLYCSMDVNYYSDGEDLVLQDGILNITARKSKISAKAIPYESDTFLLRCPDKPIAKNLMQFDYQSGLIYSKEKYTYGLYEIRFRTRVSEGLWPAFWLFGADNQEIDIFEIGGTKPSAFHVDVHCKKGCRNYPVFLGLLHKNWGDYIYTNANWNDAFHSISIDWKPEGITWYQDGIAVAWWKGSFKDPLAVIANLAVTNKEGSFGGAVSEKTIFPARLEIDYIRVWQEPATPVLRFAKPNISHTEGNAYKSGNQAVKASITRKSRPEYRRRILKTPVERISLFMTAKNELSAFRQGTGTSALGIQIAAADGQKALLENKIPPGFSTFQLPEEPAGKYLISIDCDGQKKTILVEVPQSDAEVH